MCIKKKVMVFGAGGFVGQNLCEYLAGSSLYEIVPVYSKQSTGGECLVDVTSEENVFFVLQDKRPDYIINLAAVGAIGEAENCPERAVKVNVIGTTNILSAMVRLHLDAKLLVVGSSEEYGETQEIREERMSLNPKNIYGLTKQMQEQTAAYYHQKYGCRVICTRSFNHTGRNQSQRAMLPGFCRQVAEINAGKTDERIYVGNLDIERDFTDVQDVVRAYMLLLETDLSFGVYNICSGKTVLLRELLNYIISLGHKRVEVVIDVARVRTDECRRICGSNDKIFRDTGWKPTVSVFDTAKFLYETYYHEMMKG